MASIDRSYSEKRDFIRMRVNSPVAIHHAGQDYQGFCKDLSGAGMLLETDRAFDIGTEVEVSIEQKCETHLPFNARATVSRVEDNGDTYLVGLSITDILN